MRVWRARCACGALSAACRGAPLRVSVCHCLDCQRRGGAPFAVQARWAAADVTLTGEARTWTRTGDEGGRAVQSFCPTCGGVLAIRVEAQPGVVAVPVGAFADPAFPAPTVSVYEARRHPWAVVAGEDVTHLD